MNQRILIAINALSENPCTDELDVLEQASLVESACRELGFQTARLAIDLDLKKTREQLLSIAPDVVFNLVETLENQGAFTFMAPSLFSSLGIPYSGSPVTPLFIASHKLLSKRELQRLELPSPNGFTTQEVSALQPGTRYILKPVWEEGSLDLDEKHVFYGEDDAMKREIQLKQPDRYFIETYIAGREFNISVLAGEDDPEVLPVAEMKFLDYPEEKPRILGFTAKWHEESFEYQHTVRSFEMKFKDLSLWEELSEMALLCWKGIGLKGYARIDFRVSNDGTPYIIDINANPCLSASGGFAAALHEAGIPFTEAIRRILANLSH